MEESSETHWIRRRIAELNRKELQEMTEESEYDRERERERVRYPRYLRLKIGISCCNCGLHLPQSTLLPKLSTTVPPISGFSYIGTIGDPNIHSFQEFDYTDENYEYYTKCIGCSAGIKIGQKQNSHDHFIISGAILI